MRKLKIFEKTGFQVTDPYTPVVIRDFRGVLFYSTESLTPKVKEFNLPTGEYIVDCGKFRSKEFPVNYPLYKLPRFERNREKPYGFKIRFGHNPNKCTIFWHRKLILFDNALKDLPLPELDFIRFHEYSHARFHTEVFCDLMAANYMLCKGYNPSQIRQAPIRSLSDKQFKRKAKFIQLTKNKNVS
jgi:hypothetical protein